MSGDASSARRAPTTRGARGRPSSPSDLRASLDPDRDATAMTIVFAGRPIAALSGDSIADCLVRAGVLATRSTSSGAPRGVFCGIGVCHDCLVTVDGARNVRACMTPAAPGLSVEPG
jgi:hypothetical protein